MKFKEILIKIKSPIVRIGLKNYDFSIISNNCWGGVVSRDRNIRYNSPTAGLFMFPGDYIKFLKNLQYYLSVDMKQINIYQSKYYDNLKNTCSESLVIGVLDDIELIMLHYKTFDEAKLKWDRRKKRINFDNLLVKFSDQNHFKSEYFEEFLKLDYKNKLFITTNNKYKSDITLIIKDRWNIGYAKDDIKPSFKEININRLLNGLRS